MDHTVYLPYIRKLCTSAVFRRRHVAPHDLMDFVSLFQPLGGSPGTGQRFVGSEPAEISVTKEPTC